MKTCRARRRATKQGRVDWDELGKHAGSSVPVIRHTATSKGVATALGCHKTMSARLHLRGIGQIAAGQPASGQPAILYIHSIVGIWSVSQGVRGTRIAEALPQDAPSR